MRDPTSSIRYRQNSSLGYVTTQATPLRQSRDTFGVGPFSLTVVNVLGSHKCAPLLDVPVIWFTNWPDDDYESKHVDIFITDNKLVVLTE
jgi:hypothetical protein